MSTAVVCQSHSMVLSNCYIHNLKTQLIESFNPLLLFIRHISHIIVLQCNQQTPGQPAHEVQEECDQEDQSYANFDQFQTE